MQKSVYIPSISCNTSVLPCCPFQMPALNHQDQLSLEWFFLQQLPCHFHAKPTTHAWGEDTPFPKYEKRHWRESDWEGGQSYIDTMQKLKFLARSEILHCSWQKIKSQTARPRMTQPYFSLSPRHKTISCKVPWWKRMVSHFAMNTDVQI